MDQWHSTKDSARPTPGTLCWVAFRNGAVDVMIYDPGRAGGWTNNDTWEDFDGDVVWWMVAEVPHAPPAGGPPMQSTATPSAANDRADSSGAAPAATDGPAVDPIASVIGKDK